MATQGPASQRMHDLRLPRLSDVPRLWMINCEQANNHPQIFFKLIAG
jgi:hypothetical protein